MAIESDSVVLEVDGRQFDRWDRYSFNSDFLIPSDAWEFTLGGDAVTSRTVEDFTPGKTARLIVNGLCQASGYIDAIESVTNRGAGTRVTVQGRDNLGPVLDSQLDYRRTWPENKPLGAFIQELFEPYGFTTFFIDNEENANVQAGKSVKRPKKLTKRLNEYKLRSSKPNANEPTFSFASRICQRFGLWIWTTASGDGIIVSKPDFEQPSRYRIINRIRDGVDNNVLQGSFRRDYAGQPSHIVARGVMPGKTCERVRIQACGYGVLSGGSVGPALIPGPSELKESYIVPAPNADILNQFHALYARPVYIKDDTSRTEEELKRFVTRELSLHARNAVVARYIVPGHAQNGVPWVVDSVVDVIDEAGAWEKPMWIKSRTFRKERSGGTTTELELIPLNTLVF